MRRRHGWNLRFLGSAGVAIILATALLLGVVGIALADPSGEVSWWKFDEGSGPLAGDSWDGNNGTVYGATWTTGKVGGALSFDGVNDWVQIPDSTAWDFRTADFTIDFWINPAIYDDRRSILSDRRALTHHPGVWSVEIYDIPNVIQWHDGSQILLKAGAAVPQNAWTNVAIVRKNGVVTIYYNVVSVGSASDSNDYNNGGDLYIGHDLHLWSDGLQPFSGSIDEIRIYNRALSAAEIQALYQAGTTTSVASSQNPSTYGQSVTFTAMVSPAPPATGTPTGTMQFKIDGSDFGTPVVLSGGSATSGAISSLAAGNHTVTAIYSGDTSFNGSTSPNLTQVVNKAVATVTLSNLTQTYDGTPKSATATTVPPGLGVTFTYDGLVTPPTNLGSYVVVVTVTDPNYTGSASGKLTIIITYDSLGNLVKQFVTKQGIVNSLIAKLDNAKAADTRGNANTKAGMIGAFINEVEAQTGKAISADNAAILIALAKAL